MNRRLSKGHLDMFGGDTALVNKLSVRYVDPAAKKFSISLVQSGSSHSMSTSIQPMIGNAHVRLEFLYLSYCSTQPHDGTIRMKRLLIGANDTNEIR